MTITEYGHVDLLRTGVLSNMWRLGQIVCLSYNNFLFHGEILKYGRPPRTGPSTKTHDLRNLTSQRALDYTDQIGCLSVKISRRSSLKFNAWKMAKTRQDLLRKFKITDFLLGFRLRTRRFFLIDIGVLHVFTEFRTCMWNIAYVALRWNIIGGAIEPFCHTHF